MMKSFQALHKELQVIARKLKTTLFPSGMTHGFMVLICEEEEVLHAKKDTACHGVHEGDQ
jgi:hypothetical protein